MHIQHHTHISLKHHPLRLQKKTYQEKSGKKKKHHLIESYDCE